MGVVKRPGKPKKGQKQYWYFRYRMNGRDVWESSGWTTREKTKTEAQQMFWQRMEQLAGHSPRPAVYIPGEPTLKEVVNEFIDKKRMENYSSWRSERSVLNNAVKFWGENTIIASINYSQIDRYKQHRLHSLTIESVNQELRILRALFNKAISWKLYHKSNPVTQSGMIKVKIKKERRAFTQGEIDRLLSASPAYFKDLIIAALQTGMRRGELANAKVNHVNMNQEYIFVPASKSANPRQIPLTHTMKELLIRLVKNAQDEYIFINRDNKKYPIGTISNIFSDVRERAGIMNASFHCLRHTAATKMLDAGANPTDVMYLLGHKNLHTTMIYSHPGKTVKNAILLLDM